MKKNFTLRKSLLVAALALVSVGAQAIDWKYVPLWGQFKAYPENGGKVSAKVPGTAAVPEGSNFGEPATLIDVKFVPQTLSYVYANATVTAAPNEGWKFAGFAEQKYVDDEPVIPTEAEITDNPKGLKVTSQVYSKETLFTTAEDALANFPKEPDNVYYALFTRVTVGLDYLNEQLGTVSIDKAVNDVGTEVTITATPNEDKKAKFAYWIEESTGNKITENPYKFTVSGADNYTPVFDSDNFFAVEFPAEGGYVEWYKPENLVWFPATVKRVNFMEENLKKTGTEAYFETENYTKAIPAKTATYFYGEGTQYFLDDPDDKTSSQSYMSTPSEFWSGDEGVKLDTMKVSIEVDWITEEYGDVSGYLFDKESNTFKRITDGMVPANRVFLAIPKYILDKIEEGFVPDVIYLSEEEAEAASVDGVQVDKSVKNGKIYTLDGKQVTSPKQKGVYIYDGKKLIFRK